MIRQMQSQTVATWGTPKPKILHKDGGGRMSFAHCDRRRCYGLSYTATDWRGVCFLIAANFQKAFPGFHWNFGINIEIINTNNYLKRFWHLRSSSMVQFCKKLTANRHFEAAAYSSLTLGVTDQRSPASKVWDRSIPMSISPSLPYSDKRLVSIENGSMRRTQVLHESEATLSIHLQAGDRRRQRWFHTEPQSPPKKKKWWLMTSACACFRETVSWPQMSVTPHPPKTKQMVAKKFLAAWGGWRWNVVVFCFQFEKPKQKKNFVKFFSYEDT